MSASPGLRARQRLAIRLFRKTMHLMGHGFTRPQSALLDLVTEIDGLDGLLGSVRLGGAPFYFNQLRLPYPNLRDLVEVIAGRDCYRLQAIETACPVVFDVGAHIGVFTRHVMARRPAARVFAFEPDRDNFALLTMNTAPFETATCAQQGMLDTPGELDLYTSSRLDWRSSLLIRPGFAEKADFEPGEYGASYRVPITTVDAVVAERGIDRLDLLKVTVPGEIEPRVLAGARATIARFRPQVAVYVYDVNTRAVAEAFAEIGDYRELPPPPDETAPIRVYVPESRP